jgi:hypothetical protein
MNLNKKLLLFFISVFIYSVSHAQIEVARLITKIPASTNSGTSGTQNFSANGFGAFINFGFPVSVTDAITAEGGFYYFGNSDTHIAESPLLAGYRHLLTGEDYGWYIEPVLGYTIGGTDIQKTDANGNALYKPNGNEDDQNVNGPTAGMGLGYLFQVSGRIRFNIGIRYVHAFVLNDPSTNIISFRISHSFSFGRRSN